MISPIRVAYLHPSSGLWGSERSLVSILRDLDRETFEPVAVLTAPGPLDAAVRADAVERHLLPWLESGRLQGYGRRLLAVLRLTAWLRRHHIGLLHLSLWEGVEGAVAWLATRLAGVPLVVGIRLQLDYVSPVDRLWLSRANCLVSVSKAAVVPVLLKRRWDWCWRIDPRRIVIIPPGRDLEALDRDSGLLPADLDTAGIRPGVDVIGMVGAIDWMKGSDIFVKAAALLLRARPDLRFVLIGAPYSTSSRSQAQYAETIAQLVHELGLSERLVITGYRDDAARLMKHLGMVVLPSRREAGSGTLIEAMALGVPVVASVVGGNSEIVKDGVTGVLVESCEPQDYAAAILALLDDRERTGRMVDAGRAWARRFDSRRITGQLEECYRQVLARRWPGESGDLEVLGDNRSGSLPAV
jgi:glycosyltransferase involved in cell wall biosynthesis